MKPRIVRAGEGETKQAPADWFVGTVWQDQVFSPEEPSRLRATRVTFTPGSRTNWHTHPLGQILYVLSGVGRYQIEGEPLQEIRPGDTVVIPPDVKHWHGSSPEQMMCHLALAESDDPSLVADWMEPVSDADFNATPQKD